MIGGDRSGWTRHDVLFRVSVHLLHAKRLTRHKPRENGLPMPNSPDLSACASQGCRGGRFSLQTTLRLGAQMVSLLRMLHNTGHVHRDIKPENFCVVSEMPCATGPTLWISFVICGLSTCCTVAASARLRDYLPLSWFSP